MPRVSVYLPEDLARRVKEARLPISSICQDALADTLRQINATAATEQQIADLPAEVALASPAVTYFVGAVLFAYEEASARGSALVEPADLLKGVLNEGGSLVFQVFAAIGIRPEKILRGLRGGPARVPLTRGESPHLSDAGATAIRAAEQAAVTAGVPINLSHLVRALLDDTGEAGDALRRAGLDVPTLELAVGAADAGLAIGRSIARTGTAQRTDELLLDLAERMRRLESGVARALGEKEQI